MKKRLLFLWFSCFLAKAETTDDLYRPTPVDNPAFKLPLGVPRMVNTNGEVIAIDFMFTTPAYQTEAFRLVLEEANRVVTDLGLPESRPITESDVVHAFICPFEHAYRQGTIGNIKTTNYWYLIKRGNKFDEVTVADLDGRCREHEESHQLPISQLDTNTPYNLATQWLAAARMDVPSLNRDYDVRVAVDGYWNGVTMGEIPKDTFTPIYVVSWLTKGKPHYSAGGGASVTLFLPTKTLLSLRVEDPKYVLRPPLTFTNLEALFPGQGKITTNYPTKPIIIDGSTYGR